MNYFSFYKDGKALYCLFLTGILLTFSSSFARGPIKNSRIIYQQYQVQGIVSDGTSPLPGVTISVKGKSNISVITDYNGHYAINAYPQDSLVVTFIGFKTKIVPVASKSKIDIYLAFDTTTLQEVRILSLIHI